MVKLAQFFSREVELIHELMCGRKMAVLSLSDPLDFPPLVYSELTKATQLQFSTTLSITRPVQDSLKNSIYLKCYLFESFMAVALKTSCGNALLWRQKERDAFTSRHLA